ncbi:hypothetical protein TIFTF001_021222 [Ficus carica]|uniref:Auxin-responsive protein n=1 Tax=Ficus carica TaxID=3494 RepID=A0AA88DAJ6_FICCA|nr:hypothetical protein TIFTF001_021222 [Ficus carica]
MNGFDHLQGQDQYSLKRRWQDQMIRRHQHINIVNISGATPQSSGGLSFTGNNPNYSYRAAAGLLDHSHDDLVSAVVPAVTVVLEGRSICQRISLHKHSSYQSLAKALRQMFAADVDDGGNRGDGVGADDSDNNNLDLSNAVPGHLIAYEDMENDLLLAGDLNWK